MRDFAALFSRLDETNKTNEKVEAIAEYLQKAEPEDAIWGIYFLTGRKPKQTIQTPKLALWSTEESGIPPWLFDECYDAVGDLAEAIALILPAPTASSDIPLKQAVEDLINLRGASDLTQRELVVSMWRQMDTSQRFVWNKLITGAFRVGVSQQLVARAISQVSGINVEVIAHRLMGAWEPTPEFFAELMSADTADADISRPYPFCLAYPLDADPETLGPVHDWAAEWKWDGIRAQLVRRGGERFLWSRGEDLITERFPEISEAAMWLPEGTVLDGEVLAWKDGSVLDFGELQLRIGRKTVGKKLLSDVPVILMCYDLLEIGGEDVRERPLRWRREQLEEVVKRDLSGRLLVSPLVQANSWGELLEHRSGSRERNVEGLVLKRWESRYRVGRQKGDWWKWKIDPYTIDAVLIYAQRGSGKRASLYTDYTFGVWHEDKLVPIAKAYSGLTDEEIREVDSFVRKNTIDKFGPVRTVKPELVFELAFEGIQKSTRHKSGIAVRFPRIARWRTDKTVEQADSLANIERMLGT